MLSAAPKAQPTIDVVHPLIHGLLVVWPLWVLIVVVGMCRLVVSIWRLHRLRTAGIFEIDLMTGQEFEKRLALLYRGMGYRVEMVGSARGDYGADLVLELDGKRVVVQAKCWRRKNVGVKAVQEAVAARAYYKADSAVVVSNSRFTEQAQTLAKANALTLWDRDDLVAAILSTQKHAPQAAASAAICARCGAAVSDRVRAYCVANSVRFGGLIYCFDDQRGFPR